MKNFPRTFEEDTRACQSFSGGFIVSNNLINAKLYKETLEQSRLVIWVGVSDLLNERHKLKSGWRFTNGALVNESLWKANEPNDGGSEEDCVVIRSGFLFDVTCKRSWEGLLCEWQAKEATRYLKKVNFVTDTQLFGGEKVKNNDNEEGIILKLDDVSKTNCFIMLVVYEILFKFIFIIHFL